MFMDGGLAIPPTASYVMSTLYTGGGELISTCRLPANLHNQSEARWEVVAQTVEVISAILEYQRRNAIR